MSRAVLSVLNAGVIVTAEVDEDSRGDAVRCAGSVARLLLKLCLLSRRRFEFIAVLVDGTWCKWYARRPHKPEDAGSNPAVPIPNSNECLTAPSPRCVWGLACLLSDLLSTPWLPSREGGGVSE